jgi:hypothetical protein
MDKNDCGDLSKFLLIKNPFLKNQFFKNGFQFNHQHVCHLEASLCSTGPKNSGPKETGPKDVQLFFHLPAQKHLLRNLVRASTILICAISISCASKTKTSFGSESETAYEKSQASGHAFALDGFTFRKPMIVRPANDFQFFFKHCSLSDERGYYSKTAYWCTEP